MNKYAKQDNALGKWRKACESLLNALDGEDEGEISLALKAEKDAFIEFNKIMQQTLQDLNQESQNDRQEEINRWRDDDEKGQALRKEIDAQINKWQEDNKKTRKKSGKPPQGPGGPGGPGGLGGQRR